MCVSHLGARFKFASVREQTLFAQTTLNCKIYGSLIIMVISPVHPHTCGFVKVAMWRFTKNVTEKIKCGDNETPYQHCVRSVQLIHEHFGQMFTNKRFAVDFKTFQKKLPDLHKKFSTWNQPINILDIKVFPYIGSDDAS